MTKKRLFFILLFLVIILGTISSVNASQNENVNVEMALDDGSTISDSTLGASAVGSDAVVSDAGSSQISNAKLDKSNRKSFKDLNKLISGSKQSKIYLKYDYVFNPSTDAKFKDGIVINKAVTIRGNGHFISGSNEARLFTVKNSKVVLQDLRLVKGKTSQFGGAVYGKCKVVKCAFKNNNASRYGGALYGASAVKCAFIANHASFGGAMYKGAASACTFTNNTAYFEGGAMYYGRAVNCVFNKNAYTRTDTSPKGGAMCGGSAVGCTFNTNKAYKGGAIYNGSAVNCVFNNNKAYDGGAMYNGAASKCVFKNNKVHYGGGATYAVTAKSCKFVKNTALYGGAMAEGKPVSCVFQSNKATYFADDFYRACDIYSSDVRTVYNSSDYLVATLKDYAYNPIKGAKLTINIGDLSQSMRTDSEGQIMMALKDLARGNYTTNITFEYKNIMKAFREVKISII